MKLLHLPVLVLITIVFPFCSSSNKTSAGGSSSTGSGRSAAKLDANTFKLTEVSADDTYGYSEKNPIQVGGKYELGAKNEQHFLNALLSPGGESVTYSRQGSCCAIKSKNALFGDSVPLDRYEVTYPGLEKPIILYINMYDDEVPMKAPKGFTFRK